MSTELDFPVEKEMQAREEGNTGKAYVPDARIFRPRPFKGKGKFDNKVIFGLIPINQFEWFRSWPSFHNYYLKLMVHKVIRLNEDGYPRTVNVLCETSMNKYASELSEASRVVPAPFPGAVPCAYCQRANAFWTKFRDQKKEAGIEGVTTEKYKELMKQHPEIEETRNFARDWSAQERFYFLVFDYSKWLGEVKLEENESEEMGWQAWLGPPSILDGLYAEQKLKNKFWDFANGKGRAISITRDNARGASRCEYTVRSEQEAPQLDGETTNYILNPPFEDLHDPSNFIIRHTPEEKKAYVAQYGSGSPTPREEVQQAGGEDTQQDEPEKPSVEVPVASSRPRPRLAAPQPQAPTPPPPTVTATVEAPAAAGSESPPIPAEAAPRRSKVSWRK